MIYISKNNASTASNERRNGNGDLCRRSGSKTQSGKFPQLPKPCSAKSKSNHNPIQAEDNRLRRRLSQCQIAPIRPGIMNPSPPISGLFRAIPGYSGLFRGANFLENPRNLNTQTLRGRRKPHARPAPFSLWLRSAGGAASGVAALFRDKSLRPPDSLRPDKRASALIPHPMPAKSNQNKVNQTRKIPYRPTPVQPRSEGTRGPAGPTDGRSTVPPISHSPAAALPGRSIAQDRRAGFGQHGRDEDRENAQGLGEGVEHRVKAPGLSRILRQLPRRRGFDELIAAGDKPPDGLERRDGSEIRPSAP